MVYKYKKDSFKCAKCQKEIIVETDSPTAIEKLHTCKKEGGEKWKKNT